MLPAELAVPLADVMIGFGPSPRDRGALLGLIDPIGFGWVGTEAVVPEFGPGLPWGRGRGALLGRDPMIGFGPPARGAEAVVPEFGPGLPCGRGRGALLGRRMWPGAIELAS